MKKEIINCYNSEQIINYCKKLDPNNWQDLRGDVITRILSLPEDEFKNIKSMQGFIMSSIRNRHLDNKKKRGVDLLYVDSLSDFADIPNIDYGIRYKVLSDCFNNNRFYEARVFVYSHVFGSCRALASILKIEYRNILKSYTDYQSYLRNFNYE